MTAPSPALSRAAHRLRGLSLWNPHAGLMALGAKAVESRGRKMGIPTGPLAIASTLAVGAEYRDSLNRQIRDEPAFAKWLKPQGWHSLDHMPRGLILALVWVTGEYSVTELIRQTIMATYGRDELLFGYYVERNVALIRDLRDNPPVPKAAPAAPTFAELNAEELAELDADERAEYDAELAAHKAKVDELAQVESIEPPLSDDAAAALRGVVFPPAVSAVDEGLSFETPDDRGGTKAPEGETNAGNSETKAPADGTAPPAEGKGKGRKKDPGAAPKERGRKPKTDK